MKVVDLKDWPKQVPYRDRGAGIAALIEGDFDAIAALLSTKPKVITQRATKSDPLIKYRAIFLVLSNRVPAALYEYSGAEIELHLQVLRDEFAFEDDLNEVISDLKLDPKKVKKFGHPMVTWLPNRKAKMGRRKEPPLPEDWWNHVPAISFSNTRLKK